MRNRFTKLVSAIIFILFTISALSFAQVPDDINGRLWRLSKVWGFVKYYHPDNCDVQWNALVLKAIDSILVSTSNASFNSIIAEMLSQAGPIPHAVDPLVINADTNLNANFEWIDDFYFSYDIRASLDSIRLNFRPGDNCLVKYNDYSDPNYSGWLNFTNDNILNIPSFSYSIESNRLLAFFSYWNIINYFHPDKDLMDQDWDSTLFQFIPLFRAAQNDEEFHVRFLNLVTYLNDSHGFTSSNILTNYLGTHYLFLKTQLIENQTVITKVGPNISDISVGDILKKINGLDVNRIRDSLAYLSPASNESSRQRDIDHLLLRGPFGSLINLELEDSTGVIYTASINRKYSANSFYTWLYEDTKPTVEITQCGYGYVNMGKLTTGQVPQMYLALKNTPAIIFDVRNYPNGTINDILRYLYSGPRSYALFTEPDLSYPGWYDWSDNKNQLGSFTNANPYNGKVIILVNAETQSHAEYTVMGLQQHLNAFTIGSQTAGADGNVSNLVLPGGLNTYWTSLGIFYPDTTTAQRVGVRIDSIVKPTIEDIRRGRDAVLLAAFDCLTTSLADKPIVFNHLNVYPNPVKDILNFELETEDMGEMTLSLYNVWGQQVYRTVRVKSGRTQVFQEDLDDLPSGEYVLVINIKDITYSEKIIIQK